MNTTPPRIVLDTNVCLDLWVFGDAGAAGLLAALQAGALQAVTNTSCRDEWLRVLLYPQLQLTDSARTALADSYDALVHCLPDDSLPLRADTVPRCADPDDQKFLQLALTSGARWLVSRDGDVLALGRRTRRDGLFEIVSPQGWAMTTEPPTAPDTACP
ncbi:MAG: putative toxin-antitoxin system toxin component, PIN family [Lysobacter sp.]